jgi:acyl-[acyl-carrier-protein]-phospholipid O-acyltransferase / long-chain-fatty-acid--[acyl-carrier-protein] ligase
LNLLAAGVTSLLYRDSLAAVTTHSYRETLRRPGFQAFLWTQFLGAFNDNLFKMVVSMLAVRAAAGEAAARELSIVSALFVLPFLLFSGYAGQLADMYSKRTVLVVSKSLEVGATSLALVALTSGHLYFTYGVLFLLAVQATFFGPAKYGILPEMLPQRDLSRANGVLEMSTFVAIVFGTAVGGSLFELWQRQLWVVGLAVVAIAVVGAATSLRIPAVPPAAPTQRMLINPWGEIWNGVIALRRDRTLWWTMVGLSYFWGFGALVQLASVLFGTQVMGLRDSAVGLLMAIAAISVGVGSLTAGRLSGDGIDLRLTTIGTFGMGTFTIALSYSGQSFALAAGALGLTGFFGGLFAVPLNALLQHRSETREKGRIQATNNFLNMVAITLASGALALSGALQVGSVRIFQILGVVTVALGIGSLSLLPEFQRAFGAPLRHLSASREVEAEVSGE